MATLPDSESNSVLWGEARLAGLRLRYIVSKVFSIAMIGVR